MWKVKKSIFYLILMMVVVQVLLVVACNKKNEIHIIGVINVVPDLDQTLAGFKEGMTELGYIEGENIRYVYDGPTTDLNKLDTVAQNILNEKVDLILTMTTPATIAAKNATADNKLPVVFAIVTDPVGAGIVKSIQHPGGNVTGVTFGIQEARRLEWLIKIVPEIKNIYIPFNPNDKSPVLALKMLQKAAEDLEVKLLTREYYDSETLDEAIMNIPDEANALFLLPDSMMSTRLTDIVMMANKRNLPTSASNISAVKSNNCLTAFGFDQHFIGKQSARLVDQIYKGVKPSDLPVEIPEFYLAINLKTAEIIGLKISDDILRQADIILR